MRKAFILSKLFLETPGVARDDPVPFGVFNPGADLPPTLATDLLASPIATLEMIYEAAWRVAAMVPLLFLDFLADLTFEVTLTPPPVDELPAWSLAYAALPFSVLKIEAMSTA